MHKMQDVFNETLRDFATGKLPLRNDEYIDDDGLPHCKNCKSARVFVAPDKSFIARCLCKCETEAQKRKEEEERRQRVLEEFNNRRNLSMIGNRYRNVRFADATITDSNRTVYQKCQAYVENAKAMRENNIGLYIYGDNSSGKTYLTACVCNELLWRGYRCVYTNLATILNEIRRSYDGQGMGECELIDRLQAYDFAFIDDLGKEFIGREFNAATAKWSEEKLFEIINARYNAQKPTIFSSNYEIAELASILNLDKAIIERINEMATRVLKLNGDDFRTSTRSDKSELAKRLGI